MKRVEYHHVHCQRVCARTTKTLETKKSLTEIPTDELMAFLRTTEDVVSVYLWDIGLSHLIEIQTRRFKYGVLQY